MNADVGWVHVPLVGLLWTATLACLIALGGIGSKHSLMRSRQSYPSLLEIFGGGVASILLGLVLIFLLVVLHRGFGIFFVAAVLVAVPFVVLALQFSISLDRVRTWRGVRISASVMGVSLLIAFAYALAAGLNFP